MKLTKLWKTLFCLATAAGLASCMAHGQARDINVREHRSYVPYDKAFYENLLTGRAWIFEGRDFRSNRGLVSGFVYSGDGERLECLVRLRMDKKPFWRSGLVPVRWSIDNKSSFAGAGVRWDRKQKNSLFSFYFYDPDTGEIANEILIRQKRTGKPYWVRATTGQIQDSWPRALADACPGLKLPAGMAINEKQTSLMMDELRRRDPDAPVRNFPGSEHRAPGTTGLGASGGAPTTTREEVEAYLRAQEGNVLKSPSGRGYAYTRYGGQEELWQLGDEGMLETWSDIRRSADGTRATTRIGDLEFVYVEGYPFPFAPTGHRHPAWQITDWLIGSGRVLEIPELGAAWRGVRFHAGNRTEAHPAGGGAPVEGAWRWTKGQLQVAVQGASAGAGHWRDIADRLGMGVKVWTAATPNTGT